MNLKTVTRGGVIAAMCVVLTATPGLWIGLAGFPAPVIFNALGVMAALAAPLFVMLKRNPELIGLEKRL